MIDNAVGTSERILTPINFNTCIYVNGSELNKALRDLCIPIHPAVYAKNVYDNCK